MPGPIDSKDAGRRGTNKDTVAVIVMFIGTKAHLIIKATTQVVGFNPARRTAGGVHSSGVQSRFYRETIVHAKTPQPAHEKSAFNG